MVDQCLERMVLATDCAVLDSTVERGCDGLCGRDGLVCVLWRTISVETPTPFACMDSGRATAVDVMSRPVRDGSWSRGMVWFGSATEHGVRPERSCGFGSWRWFSDCVAPALQVS